MQSEASAKQQLTLTLQERLVRDVGRLLAHLPVQHLFVLGLRCSSGAVQSAGAHKEGTALHAGSSINAS